ncbi:MAG: alpha/beta hydrolase [Coprobacillaceae bacterium]
MKIVGIVSVILVLIISVAGYFIGDYFYNLALNPEVDKSVILNSPQNEMDEDDATEVSELNTWFTNSNYSDEYMQSRDDLKLHAYQIENEVETNKWVIICHGYTSEASNMTASAKNFNTLGYNILLPDARGHGQSEGDYIGMGWDERLDIVDWIDQIIEKDKDAQIVLYGVSMGGATVMMTSGEDLPSNVKVIVEDCGYTSVRGIFSYQLQETFGLPSFPVMDFANLVTNFKAGYSLNEASAIEQVKKSKTPILFIHGDEDTFVPSHMVEEVYEAATIEKDIYIVPGAGHGAAATVAGEAYWQTVDNFISKYIK